MGRLTEERIVGDALRGACATPGCESSFSFSLPWRTEKKKESSGGKNAGRMVNPEQANRGSRRAKGRSFRRQKKAALRATCSGGRWAVNRGPPKEAGS